MLLKTLDYQPLSWPQLVCWVTSCVLFITSCFSESALHGSISAVAPFRWNISIAMSCPEEEAVRDSVAIHTHSNPRFSRYMKHFWNVCCSSSCQEWILSLAVGNGTDAVMIETTLVTADSVGVDHYCAFIHMNYGAPGQKITSSPGHKNCASEISWWRFRRRNSSHHPSCAKHSRSPF